MRGVEGSGWDERSESIGMRVLERLGWGQRSERIGMRWDGMRGVKGIGMEWDVVIYNGYGDAVTYNGHGDVVTCKGRGVLLLTMDMDTGGI